MRSAFALAGLAILSNINVALAGPCKPHGSTSHNEATLTTAAPTTSETKESLVVKNVIGNGNFAVRDPTNPSNIPNYTVEGQGQIVENKGYTGDGSKEKGCVELQASNTPTGRKRAIGNIVSISQQLDSLDIKKKYTIRFFYAVITASQINVCTLSASIAGHVFYTSTILSIGTAIDWNTVLEQTDVPNAQGAFSVSVNCPIGGIAAIYVDSIFMSNQVTPETIDDVAIDFGDGGVATTTSRLPAGTTTSKALSSEESTKSSTGTDAFTSETGRLTTSLSLGPATETFHPSTKSFTTVSFIGSETTVSQEPSTANEFTVPTLDLSTASEKQFTTLTLDPTTSAPRPSTASEITIDTASSLPTGSHVCPVGAPPPGYCTPVQPEVTQMVSLPGIQQVDDNDQPTAPRACWAFGKAKRGPWGQTRSSHPRQNSIADCALLCKQVGDACKAFALGTLGSEPSCWMLGDTLGVAGIDLNAQNSLMWNDYDCFECHDCDIKNPADIETSTLAPSTTTLAAIETTSSSPSIPTLCPNCHLKSSPSSDLVCEKIGNLGTVDLEPYANNDFDIATMQTNSEQCATICYQIDGCAASAHDAARGRCIFTNVAMTSSSFQVAQNLDAHDYILPWSSRGCWSCSTDCSAQHDTTSQAPTSTEHTVESTTMIPTRTEPLTTFSSSYVPTITESSMPQCTLALSDGCTFDQNDYDYQDCNKQGTMKNTFTLEDNEYPWQEGANSYQNCVALCNQMPHRCKSSAWDQNQQACVFSSNSIFTSAFTSGNSGDQDMQWSDQSCFKCFCHDQDRDAYSASLRTSLPTATCAPSITSEDAVCSLKQADMGDLVCQHQGYFPWQWDEAPSKFPNQDSEERCAALCNSNPDCQASGWSEEYGKCAIGVWQLKGINWQQFGETKLSWSDKGCWDCSDCIKSQKWRIWN
ncbi:hypothetical protein FVEG_05729 [Fusarium verticillioides 7600]|uniref:Apple domain-containing protein n=1 Tax=Gibberella moniliformis (strain M3125 / FGSC 7600) TaxID=334819 RepID=W7M1A9_GIBM7|nr:hypothetical protein FVEG_05729 [Fusarium verticillioides 7600]EWG44731.1 hypothetical protein FVEG_05729 [Fusarium verticillioides 7600]